MKVIVRHLQQSDYDTIWRAMQTFSSVRQRATRDEIWMLAHHPVYTLGQAGKMENILCTNNIPVIRTDRGGQVTYHGPGQLMIYTLFDVRRIEGGIRAFVRRLEQTVIDFMLDYHVEAERQHGAPGVYCHGAKLCSIGLRVKRGCSYHGLALNIDMDLSPFLGIHPCGFKHLQMTQVSTLVPGLTVDAVKVKILPHLINNFGYTGYSLIKAPWENCRHESTAIV